MFWGWPSRRAKWAELAVYSALSVFLIAEYSSRVNSFDQDAYRISTHEAVVAGEAGDPYRFRVLLPLLVNAIWRLGVVPADPAWLDRIYFLAFGVLFVATFLATRAMLTAYGWTPVESMVGPLLLAVTLPIAFRFHDYQPWSWLEALSVPLVILLLLKQSPTWLVWLVIGAASINRETAAILVLLPVAFAIGWRGRCPWAVRHYLRVALGGVLVWTVAQVLLRFTWPGPAEFRVISVAEVWARNSSVENLRPSLLAMFFLMGGVVIAALLGAKQSPRRAKLVVLLAVPIYLAGFAIFALWVEVRVIVPVVILLVPLALSAFRPLGEEGEANVHEPACRTRRECARHAPALQA